MAEKAKKLPPNTPRYITLRERDFENTWSNSDSLPGELKEAKELVTDNGSEDMAYVYELKAVFKRRADAVRGF